MNHSASIEKALLEADIPPQDASAAAWYMASKLDNRLPLNRAHFAEMISTFVSSYHDFGMEATMSALKGDSNG